MDYPNGAQGLPDDEGDRELIIDKFMAELCRRDEEDNRDMNMHNRIHNIFSVEEIRQKVLSAFEITRVRLVLRGYILDNRDNEPLEFLENEEKVRLTNRGRASVCNEI
jgi:hypothetical protein